jgi:putative transposase
MADKFQNQYRIPSSRLKGFDYGSNAMYFVTICTENRIHYFGEIVNSDRSSLQASQHECIKQLRPTIIGQIASEYWLEIPKHYPFIQTMAFVIMPNHIHGILSFTKSDKTDWTPNKFGAQSRNLAAVIRGYKSSVKRFTNQNGIQFGWQTRFHDHIIRNENALNTITNYIINNPQNWNDDSLNGHASP